ncbi:PREDICTED: transcription factor Ouib-like [Rhagoletis zephyria]|uniref:transcription factor Ouib-like n=1 Tax=Rhagoletis zephyria TaxID=28612 RepID=UPI00081184E8|nr:PREDICTED: transcription factor Ouib-like [Rhagoletis zephyria]
MRQELKLCRLCAMPSESISTIALFDRSRKSVLRRIFQITGVMLKNATNIPTAMCSDCETELSRAYDFRERCISAQTYFSSAEYKNHVGQARKKTKFSKSKTDLESTLVKVELLPSVTEDENEVKIGKSSNFEGVFKPEAYTEYLALDEDEIDHLSYDDEPIELLDQSIDNTTQKNKYLENIGAELEHLINDNETVEDTKPILLEKVVKSEIGVKDSKKDLPKKKSKGEGKNKAKGEGKNKPKGEGKNKPKGEEKNKPKGERKNKAKTYICDQCGNHFKCPTHFRSHLRRHTGVKPVQCDICPSKFFTEGELKRHMRRHTGERPFPCQYCPRHFSDYSSRIKHERTHTNERPFKCPQCDKAFTASYVLKNHMLVHTGERPLKCVPCDKFFQLPTHISTHNRTLSHKQNVEREQQRKLLQQKNEELE